jgi:menaquinone-dependent protoporphyrinogen oxidase
MATVLIAFGTNEGHTAKVAQHIADVARRLGHEVEVRPAAELPDSFSLEPYDRVLVGASVHEGHHQKAVRQLATRHREALVAKGAAFFSVSLAAAADDAEARKEATRYIDDFAQETGWRPAETETIPGALLYTQYSFFKRLLMRTIAKSRGGPTDTARDYEYTDWDRVTAFAERVLTPAASD